LWQVLSPVYHNGLLSETNGIIFSLSTIAVQLSRTNSLYACSPGWMLRNTAVYGRKKQTHLILVVGETRPCTAVQHTATEAA
jgi:hypothetical protein